MLFSDPARLRRYFEGKSVAIVGSGPGVLDNAPGFVDSHQVVVRINNFKLTAATGRRTDVFYSFFGNSIKKTAAQLKHGGVRLCICKCPSGKFMESEWHRVNKKTNGVDFSYIYKNRARFWFCPTFVPSMVAFVADFKLLGGHVPTTGFSALLEVLRHDPASVYLTGFDFFTSSIHNVDEKWTASNPDDPIRHVPEKERAWVQANASRFTVDRRLAGLLKITEAA